MLAKRNPGYLFGLGAADVQPAMPASTPPSFWDQYGGEIIIGTITAVTSALAVYFAMRVVERRGK